jgi:RNA polymerase sigma-70 factor, ECF subfamily
MSPPPPPPSATGDHRDFSTLVQAHADDLYRYARWLCRDPHRAEDLVQETLLRSWRGFAALREAQSTRAWLITTLRREYFRELDNAQARSVCLSLDDTDAPLSDDELACWPDAVEDQLDVERCLARLPDVYREVLVLQAYFGYATDEMARMLGTSETAIANRLLRARKALGEAAKAPEQARIAVVLPLKRRAP